MLSSEGFESHKCDLQLRECRTIEVSEIMDCSYDGRKLVNGWGIDGVLYTFEVVPRRAIPLMEPLSNRRKVTDFKDDGEVTAPPRGYRVNCA
jgi:hypothetical protein